VSGLSFIDNPEDEKDLMINKQQNEFHLLNLDYRETINEKEKFRFLALKAEKDREYLVRQINIYKNE